MSTAPLSVPGFALLRAFARLVPYRTARSGSPNGRPRPRTRGVRAVTMDSRFAYGFAARSGRGGSREVLVALSYPVQATSMLVFSLSYSLTVVLRSSSVTLNRAKIGLGTASGNRITSPWVRSRSSALVPLRRWRGCGTGRRCGRPRER